MYHVTELHSNLFLFWCNGLQNSNVYLLFLWVFVCCLYEVCEKKKSDPLLSQQATIIRSCIKSPRNEYITT